MNDCTEVVRRSITAQQVVDLLNEAVKLDPDAMAAFLKVSVEVNENLANHPYIVCWKTCPEETARMGLLGILIGVVGLAGEQLHTNFDLETWTIKSFRLRTPEERERVRRNTARMS